MLDLPSTLELLDHLAGQVLHVENVFKSASEADTFLARVRAVREVLAQKGSEQPRYADLAAAACPGLEGESLRVSFARFQGQLEKSAHKAGLRLKLIKPAGRRRSPDEILCHFEGTPLPINYASPDAESTLSRENEVIQAKAAEDATRIFVSFAVADRDLVTEFMDLLQDNLPRRCGKPVLLWRFDERGGILPGEDNEAVIRSRMNESRFGLLLLSPKYFRSKFIERVELPHFVGPGAKAHPIPVALCDFTPGRDRHEEFDKLNVFQHQDKNFRETYKPKRGAFIKALCEHIADLIDKHVTPPQPALEPASHPSSLAPAEDGHYIEPSARTEALLAKSAAREEKEDKNTAASVPVLDTLRAWFANKNDAAYMALLGESGAGKTMTCCKLDHILNEERPGSCIYLDLRHLNASGFLKTNHHPRLEDILSQTLSRSTATHLSPQKVLEAVRDRAALLIWDGLDEVLVHLSTLEGEAFFRQLKEALPPSALHSTKGQPGRLLMACRTQYFRSFEHESSALTDAQRGPVNAAATDEVRARFRVLRLLPFDDGQIRGYLTANVPGLNVDRAFEVIKTVHNLHDLAQRPYCLSIMRSSLGDLDALLASRRKVYAVDLYESLVRSWLARDDTKHRFDQDDKPLLMARLAAWMWREGRKTVTAEELTAWLKKTLLADPTLKELYGDALKTPEARDALLQDFRTATFIARWDGDAFRFAHTSLQEYFLACHLVRSLTSKEALEAWDMPLPSLETLDFIGQLLSKLPAGEQKRAMQSMGSLMGQDQPAAAYLAFRYWLEAIQKNHPEPSPQKVNLAGACMDELLIAGRPGQPLNLRGAQLRGVSFNRSTIKHVVFNGADLSGVEARQATLHEVEAEEAVLEQADLCGVQWRGGSLKGAHLSSAKIHGCEWVGVDLTGTELPADWDHEAAACGATQKPQIDARATAFLTRVGHSGGVWACAWSPDGSKLLSGSDDNTLKVWDALSGSCLTTLEGHLGSIQSCRWSANNEKLASSSDDNTLKIWDAQNGQCLATLKGHSGPVNACDWSPDCKRLLSGSSDKTLKTWDTKSAQCLLTLIGHSAPVTACAWSSDGLKILSASLDKTLKIWDVQSSRCLLTLQGHSEPVIACAWSPDGSKILSGSSDNTLRIWDAISGRHFHTIEGHSDSINDCSWSPDGKKLLSASQDQTLRVWDADSGQCQLIVQDHSIPVRACMWSPDSLKLLSGSFMALKTWDAEHGKCQLTMDGHSGEVYSCSWSSDGRRLASGSADKTIKVWDVTRGQCLFTLKGHPRPINKCEWSPNGEKLVSVSWDGTLKIWNTDSFDCILTLQVHADGQNICTWSPDSKKLVTFSGNNTLKIIDSQNGQCLQIIHGYSKHITGCSWSHDGKKILSCSRDGTIQIWDAHGCQQLLNLQGHSSEITACSWNFDDKKFVSSSWDQTLKIWDAANGVCLRKIHNQTTAACACTWSPDGGKLLTANYDATLKIWDAESGACLLIIQGHSSVIRACAWSPDGSKLLSGSDDNTLKVWDALSGSCLWTGMILPNEQTVSLDAQGRLLSCSQDAWRWLGWRWTDPRSGDMRVLPAEHFGPLPVQPTAIRPS